MGKHSEKFMLLLNEGHLVAEILAHGVSCINKTSKNRHSLYYQVFFNLSIGFERLLKLILITHKIYRNEDVSYDYIKKLGHKLKTLQQDVLKITELYYPLSFDENRISLPIHSAIINELNEFANRTRYHNLDKLGQENTINPIESWEKNIIRYIRKNDIKRYSLSKYDKEVVAELDAHTAFDMQDISSWKDMIVQSAENPQIEKFLRLYIMQIIREYSQLLVEISNFGWEEGNENIPYFKEIFGYLIQKDSWYKSHKTYSIYGIK